MNGMMNALYNECRVVQIVFFFLLEASGELK